MDISPSAHLPLVLFCLSTMLTPGPNNIMLTASGAAFGYRRTIPHIAGVTLGMGVQVLLVGMGMGQVFERVPALHTALGVVGSAYLLWLAWKIAHFQGVGHEGVGHDDKASEKGRPLTMLQAIMFQWVNPKAWMMCISAVSAFTRPGPDVMGDVWFLALVFVVMIPPCISVWTLMGVHIGRLLRTDWLRRAFNVTLALLLAGSLALMHLMDAVLPKG